MQDLDQLLKLGWKIFPCHSIIDGRCTCSAGKECGSPGKHPRLRNGVHGATDDPAIVHEWSRTWPETNWGLACGEPSGVVVIDIDAGHGGFESIDEYEEVNGALMPTLTATSGGGGRHRFYAYQGDQVKNRTNWLPGVDVRSTGGYVILAPGTHKSGGRYRWDNFEDALIAELPVELERDLLSKAGSSTAKDIPSTSDLVLNGVAEGKRDDTIFRWACKMRRNFSAEPDEGRGTIEFLAKEAAAKSGFPEAEAMKCVAQAFKQDHSTPQQLMAFYELKPLTDLGNVDRFLELHGDDLRFVPAWGWFTWSDRGWTNVNDDWMVNRIKDVVGIIREEMETVTDSDLQKEYVSWYKYTSSKAGLKNIFELARTSPLVHRAVEDFDKNPLDLACENGIVDLRTGQIRAYSRTDLVTKNTGIKYDPTVKGELWEQFLDISTQGDLELKDYLQRVAGYTATGLCNQDTFYIISGPPASGKSSFMDAMMGALGTYAVTTPAETIMWRRNQETPDRELARLAGIRLASVSEIEEGARFNNALVKKITGGDRVTGRQLYKDSFEFAPQFKLWIATNHDPASSDDGIMRRLKRIGFRHAVAKEDRNPNLKEALRTTELEAVLAWMVEGAMKFLAQESPMIQEPSTVTEAVKEYQESQDTFGDFWDELVVVTANGETSFNDIYRGYRDWCKGMGAYPTPMAGVRRALTSKGFNLDGAGRVAGISMKAPSLSTMPWA